MKISTIYVVLTVLSLFLLASCATQQGAVKYNAGAAQETGPEQRGEYVIQPGDELDIKFFYNPELNESVIVRPDGKISLQLVD